MIRSCLRTRLLLRLLAQAGSETSVASSLGGDHHHPPPHLPPDRTTRPTGGRRCFGRGGGPAWSALGGVNERPLRLFWYL